MVWFQEQKKETDVLKHPRAHTGHVLNPDSCPGQCGSVGCSVIPYTKRWQVQFLIRARTQVAGSVPSWGVYGRQLINVSPTHTPPPIKNQKPGSSLFPSFGFFFREAELVKIRLHLCPDLNHKWCCRSSFVQTFMGFVKVRLVGGNGVLHVSGCCGLLGSSVPQNFWKGFCSSRRPLCSLMRWIPWYSKPEQLASERLG